MSGTNGLGAFSVTIVSGTHLWSLGGDGVLAVGASFFLNPVAGPPLGSPGLPAPFVTGVEYYVTSLNGAGQFTLASAPGGSAIASTQAGAAAFTAVIPVLQGGAGSDYITSPQARAPRDVPTPYSPLDVSYLNQRVETGTFGLSQPAVSSPGYAPPTIPHP